MKQVIFAIALLAMASLTGCLNGDDDSSVDDTTDDTTSDTTEDNTDTTQDDTDTTDDTKDDELIDPVGGNGDITIPEDSSIHIDVTPSWYGGDYVGTWECTETEGQPDECEFVYFINDYFHPDSAMYFDADYEKVAFDFLGWVNKTGETVTIEGMHYPYRDSYIQEYTDCCLELDGDGDTLEEYNVRDYRDLGRPFGYCNWGDVCTIIFYGYGGLTFNSDFTLSADNRNYEYWTDEDEDGFDDTRHKGAYYEYFTVTFDLPFEPYGFSVIQGSSQIDRVF